MLVSPFTIGLILASIVYFLVRGFTLKKLYLFSVLGWVICDLMLNVGYFIKLGSTVIRYSEAFLAISFVLSILLLIIDRKADCTLLLCSTITLICIGLSVVAFYEGGRYEMSMLESSTDYSWDMYAASLAELQPLSFGSKTGFLLIKYVMASVTIAVFLKEIPVFMRYRFGKTLFRWYCAFGVFLVLEAVTVYIFKSNALRTATLWIFGNHELGNTDINFSGRLYGLFSEPSMLSLSLFVFLLLALVLLRRRLISTRIALLTSLIALILMVASRSFSSVLYLGAYYLVLVVYLFRVRASFVVMGIALLVPIVGIVTILNVNGGYFLSRVSVSLEVIGDITGKARTYSSEWIRLHSIAHLLQLFAKHPIFGVGFNSTYSYSAVSSSLATIGLVGTAALIIHMNVIYKKMAKKSLSPFALIVFLFVFSLVGSMGSLMLYYPSCVLVLFLSSTAIAKHSSVPYNVVAGVKVRVAQL